VVSMLIGLLGAFGAELNEEPAAYGLAGLEHE
jgi:hypothetical protein